MNNRDNEMKNNGHKLASQASLQLLPLIMDNIPQAVFWKDQNLVYLGCNRAFAEDAGFTSPEEVIGKTDFDMPWKDQAELYRADDRHVLDGGEPKLDYEEPQTSPNGSTIWLRTSKIPVCENGRVVAILGMYEDITERKQAENLHQQSERLFRALFEMSPDAVTLIDPYDPSGDWPIVDCNTAACQINGYSREEMIGQPINIVNAPTDNPIDRTDYLKQLRETGAVKYEIIHRRRDGTTFPVEVSTTLIKVGDRELLLGIDRDITQRKRAEMDLLLRDRALASSLNAVLIAGLDFKPIYVNDALLKMTGYTHEEAMQLAVTDLTGDPEGLKQIDESTHTQGFFVGEEPIKRKDGSIFPSSFSTSYITNAEGKPIAIQTSFFDVTERKQAEKKQQESERLFQDLFAFLPDAFMLVDPYDPSGTWPIVDCNAAACAMSGYEREELIGQPIDIVNAPSARATDRSDYLKQLREKPLLKYETFHCHKNGTLFPVEVSTTLIKVGNRELVVGIDRDITERKQAEVTLRDNEERLRAIYEGTNDAVMLLDERGFFDCNSQTLKMFDYMTKEEFTAIHPSDASPKLQPDGRDSLAASQEYIQNAYRQGYERFEWMHRRSNGEEFPAEVLLSAIDLGGRRVLQATVRDITERKQVELALQENQKFLQTVMDNIPQSIFWKDKNLTYLGCNSAFAMDAGVASPNDIPGKTDWDMPWKEQAELYRDDDSQVMKSGVPKLNYEEPQTNPQGQITWLRTSKIPLYDRDGNVTAVLGMYEDITARKQIESELKQEKALSDAIINALPSTFFLFDIQGKMLRWNEQYEKESGYTAEDMQTISVIQTLVEQDREKALAAIQQALVEGHGAVEANFITKDGRSVPYYFAGRRLQTEKQTYLVGTGMNLTERKLAEAEIQREKALSDAIINGLPGVFYLFDTQGRMIRWNKQYEQVLGYTAEETAARTALDPIADDYKERVLNAIQHVFTEGQARVEADFVTKDGQRIPYYFAGQLLNVGDQVYLAGTGIDITDRKRLEVQVQEALERRGLQVKLSTQVAQSIASATSLEELYERVVTQVKEQFGYYHTQLLRYDPAQDAVVLVTGYGETGEKMLAAGHRLPMGQGLIGTAAATGETVLRPALENDPEWRPNPLLPETKGEIAVPIKLGDTIVGVLDVQSSAANALDADDQLLLEGLCGQIAVAIESTRLRQDMSERLEEINRLYRAMSREGWQNYMGTGNVPAGFMYDQKGLRPVEDPSLAEERFSSLPLTVPGGEVIGTLAVAEDPQRTLSPEDELFLEQVSEQIALALESARLFEQTQEGLAWQQAINHTSILIGQAKGVPEITRATAELLPLLNMASCSINLIKEFDANGSPAKSDIFIVRFENNEFEIRPPVLDQSTAGWLPEDRNYYQTNRVTVFPDLDDLTTMVPYDAYQAPVATAYMRKAGMRSAITLALGVQNRPIGYLTFNSQTPLAHVPEKHITWLATIVDLVSTTIDAQLLLTETENGRQTLARRAAELETVATVSTTASTVLDPDQLLNAVVNLTQERFELYHTHIYLLNPDGDALTLAAGAGEIGQQMLAEGWSIPVDHELSMIADACRKRQTVVANDVHHDKESTFLSNRLLPDTRSEMALPLIVGEKILGVFDVQSKDVDYFTADNINVYTTLASQVAVALQNARLYMEQAALVTQLRELDKLKSSFLANMSHELRTPLNSILGFADVILEELDGPLTENMGTDLRLIQKNGQHLLHLINDVLDMAKIEAGRMNLNPERFTAFEVLDEVTSITSTLASEKHIALFIDPASDQQIKIFADRTRLRQVMINLVNNAIKFTEAGKISLKLDALEGGRVLYAIKDTGIGISLDKQEAIFQEFTQVDSSTTRKAGGTGLGLPISRRLVEMHGGRLWVESTGVPGEGSTFFVELPIEARITEIIEK